MSLDAVRSATGFAVANINTSEPIFDKWRNFPVSVISHHGSGCCETAREWLFSMDFSERSAESILTGPRWIRQRYVWGPTRWQIYWCEAIDKKMLDCGALAAFAHEVFEMRGVKSFRVQLVQEFSAEATAQWTRIWSDVGTSVHWINKSSIYHESCAVLIGENEVKVWDSSAGWWIDPKQCAGYGAVRAIRLLSKKSSQNVMLNWGSHRIIPNQWQSLKM